MARRLIPAAVALALLACAAPASAGFRTQLDRRGLVDLSVRPDSPDLDLRYATENNFTGAVLPGYCEAHAYLRRRAARALERVQTALERDGAGLLVYDAYRPARATRAMVRWAKRTNREDLLNGYIARRSNHNRGAAVDLTLARYGRAVNMGTEYDSFSPRSATTAVGGKPLRNRLRLRKVMEAEGFRNYSREWWHYDYPPDLGAPLLDIAPGC